jgi:hypothetical protein
MADITGMLQAAAGAGGAEETDPNFNQTVLLLHGDGTNGAQNNTFLDSSTNNFTITRNGNTTQGTFSPFSAPDGRWSNYFDGTNDRLTIADNAALRPGTSAFTIEAWVYRATAGAAHTIFAKGASTPTGFAFLITSSDTLRFTDTSTDITSTGTVAANTWVHVAAVREGTGSNQLKLYINGVQDGTGTSSTNFTQTEEARIGENRGATDDFNGYISNFRYVIGTALYTAGFTPSTSPLTTTSQGATSSEVELLTCQSNRFVDNSSNAFAITRNNDVKVTPFSPFAPPAAYDPAVNSGSLYFDGTSDSVTAPDDADFEFGTGDFTIEMFVYPTTASGTGGFISKRALTTQYGPYSFGQPSANTPSMLYSFNGSSWGINVASSITMQPFAWNHLAWTRSGSTFTLWVNGQSGVTATNAGSLFNNSAAFSVGALSAASQFTFLGHISQTRVIKGTCLYTTAFTPPTAPLTAVSGTVLLLEGTNAGILDNTGKNNLDTVGNAQIDTTTKKYGTGSMEFDGTGDYLTAPGSTNFDIRTGAFCIECWVYRSATGNQHIIGYANEGAGANDFWDFGIGSDASSTNKLVFRYQGNSAKLVSTNTLSTGQFYHVAATGDGTVLRIFINGNLEASATAAVDSTIPNTKRLGIGTNLYGGIYTQYLNGFIDDLRITKGVARYTANFTPPTKAFPDL